MTLRELYNFILENYGERACWISELASMLGISEKKANHLTYVLGYRRGRSKQVVEYEVFSMNPRVCEIHKYL